MPITLYPRQQQGVEHLAPRLLQHGAVLDASDTGTGKTFTALGVAKRLARPPLIVCPKAIVTAWRRAASALDVDPLDILNVEKLRTGRRKWVSRSGPRKADWAWNLPADSFVIWDEVQNAGGKGTLNAYLLANLRFKAPVLMLSATVADNPLRLQAPGYLLELHRFRDFLSWCLRHGCFIHPLWGGLTFKRGPQGQAALLAIHRHIFPERGYRVRIADLEDFPETQIITEAVDVQVDRETVNGLCGSDFWQDDMDPAQQSTALTGLLRARQMTELAKVPVIVDRVNDLLEEGRSVVIFICFRETMDQLHKLLPAAGRIYGGQSSTDRDAVIEAFQSDALRLLICNTQAGGVGISLHDLRGQYPRHTLLTPPLSVVQLKQALGRTHRSGGRSKSVQTILFAANTVEEGACEALSRKLNNLSLLNDGTLLDLKEGNLNHEQHD